MSNLELKSYVNFPTKSCETQREKLPITKKFFLHRIEITQSQLSQQCKLGMGRTASFYFASKLICEMNFVHVCTRLTNLNVTKLIRMYKCQNSIKLLKCSAETLTTSMK